MSRGYDSTNVQIRFVWNPNAIRGYILAIIVLAIILGLSMCSGYEPPMTYVTQKADSLVLLRIGDGDGTGQRSGNMQERGAASRGKQASMDLEDAQKLAASSNRQVRYRVVSPSAYVPVAETPAEQGADAVRDADASEKSVGVPDGSSSNTGLSWVGSGTGKGLGYGDVDWGGGGNRQLISKVAPTFPQGTMNTTVVVRFQVKPNGSVGMISFDRDSGIPSVNNAVERALKLWRFKELPPGDTRIMEGVITITFRNV